MNKTIGILRKTNSHQLEPDINLLVFGYQSKLYRNDAKAIELDRETHLIPAPFDSSLQISRYDVRATLDAAPCESHNYMNRLDYLSPAEQQAEQMAEKERYYSLYINEVEEELYKEEQEKRQQSNYNQIAFSYDDDIGPKESTVTEEPDEADTTPFSPAVKLNIPADMEIPATVKINQIIEKTAKFISSQGAQMEILLKTKQSANPQFNFLNHDGQFNSYYKYILALMKEGTYPWQETESKSEDNSQDSTELDANGKYEHTTTMSAIIIPKMVFKPSADCAYTQLISKITKAPIAEIEKQRQQENDLLLNGAGSSTQADVKKSSGLTGLVHYSSDSESETEEEITLYTGPIPPSELQLVIDKTASYVAKNGVEFEEKLLKKQDTRFQFLDETNEFHKYYVFKVNESREPGQPLIARKPKEEVKMPKTPPAPVCFSIKAKEEKSPLKQTDVLQASSDDENKAVELPQAPTPPRISVEEELEKQVDALNAEREEKLAKDKLTDKLMNAAREKLGMLPKEKMLQIERKKKALMFINQIKGSNGNPNGDVKADEIINLTHADDSDDSVRSIPVTTTPPPQKLHASARSRSRKRSSSSTSRSSSSTESSRTHKRSKSKKSKSHRSKKKYHKKSRSRSRDRPKAKRDRRDRRH